MADKPRVLCVDDEPNVLEGLTLTLRRRYEVRTAPGGAEGLELLGRDGPFAVVLSDMRMPGMDGAAFLARARRRAARVDGPGRGRIGDRRGQRRSAISLSHQALSPDHARGRVRRGGRTVPS